MLPPSGLPHVFATQHSMCVHVMHLVESALATKPALQRTLAPFPSALPQVFAVQHSSPSALHVVHVVVAAFAAYPVPQETLADPHVFAASNGQEDGRY